MKHTNKAQTSKPSRKWLAIKTGRGRVTGYIEGFLHNGTGRYCTVPGVSRFLDPAQNLTPDTECDFSDFESFPIETF
jgi:hypothetical protein